jgi:hypothetical protein
MSKNFRHHPHHHLNASALASWMTTLTISSLLIKGVIPLLFVLLHCVMDELSMLLLTIPVLFPAAMDMNLWGRVSRTRRSGSTSWSWWSSAPALFGRLGIPLEALPVLMRLHAPVFARNGR